MGKAYNLLTVPFFILIYPYTYMIWQSQRKDMGVSYRNFLLSYLLAFFAWKEKRFG